MTRKRVLFICDHNSARSQMAEALLQAMGGERFEAVSAGFEPGKLNPLAVAAMSELGIDISGNATRSVFSYYRAGALFDYAITVCDEASKERCPIFPGFAKRLHLSFQDPSRLQGTEDEKLRQTRRIRDRNKAAASLLDLFEGAELSRGLSGRDFAGNAAEIRNSLRSLGLAHLIFHRFQLLVVGGSEMPPSL